MRKYLLIILIAVISCTDKGEKGTKIENAVIEQVQNENFTDATTETTISNPKKEINNSEVESVLNETRILLNELLAFKDKEDFHYYGFSGTYKYNDWLKKVGNLKDSPVAKEILLDYGFAIGDLEMLGLEYVKTKGQETKYSNWAKERIKKGLNKK